MKAIENLPDLAWNRLSPLLDDALERLSASDRDALVLRFLEGRSLDEMAQVLGVSCDGAQKRVSRALDKLRHSFSRRGVTTTAAALSTALADNSVHAAPAGFAATITPASLTAVAALPLGTAIMFRVLAYAFRHKLLFALASVTMIALVAAWWPQTPRTVARTQVGRLVTAEPPSRTKALPKPAAVADAAGSIANAEPDIMTMDPDRLSAAQALERTYRVYAECKSYFDSGVVTSNWLQAGAIRRVTHRPFRTAFARGDRFRFEFWNEEMKRSGPYIVWSDGHEAYTWWSLHTPPLWSAPRALGIAGAHGVSGGSSGTIESLLFPAESSVRRMLEFDGVTRGGNEIVDGIECIRLDGLQSTNDGNKPRTIWVEKATGLVRQIRQRNESLQVETTYSYTPMVNGEVPDELLRFDPPAIPPRK